MDRAGAVEFNTVLPELPQFGNFRSDAAVWKSVPERHAPKNPGFAAHHTGAPDKILALLEDARFCCHRAQHDAIDAAMSKMSISLDNLTSKLGFDAVLAAYPEFREFFSDFMVARDKIAKSRETREDRVAIYETLTAVDLPNLTERFGRLVAAKPIAKRAALKMKLGGLNGLLILLLALAGAIFAGLAVDWSKYGFGPEAEVRGSEKD